MRWKGNEKCFLGAYHNSIRVGFMKKLQELLKDDYEDFKMLNNIQNASYVLGSELWEKSSMNFLAWLRNIL